jgi:hypothetical protein
MFVVSEVEAAAIRTAFEQSGELAAAVELRRLFPLITDAMQAREQAERPPRRVQYPRGPTVPRRFPSPTRLA